MLRQPPSPTRTYTLFPSTTLFRSHAARGRNARPVAGGVELGRSRAPLHRSADPALHLVELPREGLGSVEPRAPARPYVGDARPDDGGGVAPHRPARAQLGAAVGPYPADHRVRDRKSTSELQSLMRISYAVFCLKKKTQHHRKYNTSQTR